ncbi:MAG: chromate transporter [Planctomycetota bacterium]
MTSAPKETDAPTKLAGPQAADSRPFAVFTLFLAFGARAFGGPLVQIEALREEFVRQRGWTTTERFDRALGVYQLLPGPEAHEMCCYLGTVRGGRLGGLAAGLGFMLPGLVLMLAASVLYAHIDLRAPAVAGALMAMQVAACALIVRAVVRLVRPLSKDWRVLVFLAAFFAALGLRLFEAVPTIAATDIAARTPAVDALFGHGLAAGLVTFGGAYTALPYVAATAAGDGGWMTQQACLDGVAIASVLPAPLVIFGTFVGYAASGIAGALAFTAGIFLPAFGFTLVGFGFFERLVGWKPARGALDALGAVAIGLIAAAALGFFHATINAMAGPREPHHHTPLDNIVLPCLCWAVAFAALHHLPTRFGAPILVLAAAAVGAAYGALFG